MVQNEKEMSSKVAFLHGRFGPHIMHGRLAKRLNAEFHIVDKYKKWNDGEHSKLYLLYAWLYNAFAFKKPNQYEYYLVSGPHFSPIFMKLFRLNNKKKFIVHLGDETMYFLFSKFYGKITQKALVWLLNNYDALFCEGQMAADLAVLNGITKPLIYTTYLGVPKERQSDLLKLTPKYSANNLIFISTGPNGWRTHYKGIDLMLDAYSLAFQKDKSLTFTIIGDWDSQLQLKLLSDMSENCIDSINFVGHTDHINQYLSDGTFYFHTARGDAFPTVVLEAMSAGLIPLVSDWTGSKEVVSKVSKDLIVPLDKNFIAQELIRLTKIPINERIKLSDQSRAVSREYTEDYALNHYRDTFSKFKNET
jgi:glycosyltransferase involved in cell wall biosynthesis